MSTDLAAGDLVTGICVAGGGVVFVVGGHGDV